MVFRTSASEDKPSEACKRHTAGKCLSGTECKLLHEFVPKQSTNTRGNGGTGNQEMRGAELSTTSGTSTSSQDDGPVIKVVQKVGEICRQWQKGRCQWGERCQFRHELKADGALISPNESENCKLPARGKQEGSKKVSSTANTPSNLSPREVALRRVKEQVDIARLARIEQEEVVQTGQEELTARLAREGEAEAAHRLEVAKERERMVARQRLEKEDVMTIQQICLNSVVKFEAGLTIRHVVCGFEASQVLVKNLPMKITKPEIINLFKSEYGIEEQNFAILRTETTRGRQQATVVGKAADLEYLPFSELEFRGANLEFTVCERSSEGRTMGFMKRDFHHLTISWRVPNLTMVAHYPHLSTPNIQQKARNLNGQLLNGQCVQAKYEQRIHNINSSHPEDDYTSQFYLRHSIKISWIPAGTTIVEVATFAGTQDITPHYTSCTTKEIFDTLDSRLRTLPNSTLTGFTLAKSSDPNFASASAVFSTWEGAKEAYDSLDGKVVRTSFPPLKLAVSNPYNFILTLDESEYYAQSNQWAELQSGLDEMTSIKTRNIVRGQRRRIVVTLSGRDRKVVGALKVRIENMATGQKLDASYWHPMLKSAEGRKFLDSLYDSTGAYAHFDWKHNCIKLSGSSEATGAAKTRIREEINRLSIEECTIPLQRRMLGFFIREGLERMRALLGEECVTLDVRAAKIVLHGTDLEEAKHHIEQLTNTFTTHDFASPSTSTNIPCPICYDTISQPIELSCGHTYCTTCLRHYIFSTLDNHNFPLKCMGNDARCERPLSLPLIQKFLPPQRFDQLMVAAFVTYIGKNPHTFRYCTTPGCSQIYRTTLFQREIQCPSCFTEICSACHDEGHVEMTCAAKRAQKHPGEHERLLEAWANKNDVKKCPSCHAWLDRTEGSNHMSCKCGVNFCWICRGAFGVGQMSAHMSEAHGRVYGVPTPRLPPSESPKINPPTQPHRHPALAVTGSGQATRAVTTDPLRHLPQVSSNTVTTAPSQNTPQLIPARAVPRDQSLPPCHQNIVQILTQGTMIREREQQLERERRAVEIEERRRREAEAQLRAAQLREARAHEARLVLERHEYEAARRKAEEEGKGWCLIM